MKVIELLLLLSVLTTLAGLLWLFALRISGEDKPSRAMESRIWWGTSIACVGIMSLVVTTCLVVF